MQNNLLIKKQNLIFLSIYFFTLVSFVFYYFNSDLKNLTFLTDGYILGNDSVNYLNSALKLLSGNILDQDRYTTISYELFLALLIYFKFSLSDIIIVQIFMSLIAGYCLFKISEKVFTKSSGYICMTLFLIYMPLQKWNLYILTDGFCANFYVYTVYLIFFFEKKFSHICLLIFTIIILFFSRGHGMLILPSLIMARFLYQLKKERIKRVIIELIPVLITIIVFLYFIGNKPESSKMIKILFNKWENNEWGIIFGYTTNIDREILSKFYFPENLQYTIIDYFNIIKLNFFEYSKLFFLKIFYCLMRIRPFFSNSHNFYLLFFDIIFYSTFLLGFLKLKKFYLYKYLIFSIIFINLLFVGITFVDWDSRFSLYFLPLLMVFSSIGIDNKFMQTKLG